MIEETYAQDGMLIDMPDDSMDLDDNQLPCSAQPTLDNSVAGNLLVSRVFTASKHLLARPNSAD